MFQITQPPIDFMSWFLWQVFLLLLKKTIHTATIFQQRYGVCSVFLFLNKRIAILFLFLDFKIKTNIKLLPKKKEYVYIVFNKIKHIYAKSHKIEFNAACLAEKNSIRNFQVYNFKPAICAIGINFITIIQNYFWLDHGS